MNSECIKILINISYSNQQWHKLIINHSTEKNDIHANLMDKLIFIQFKTDNIKDNESVFFQIVEFLLLTYKIDVNIFGQM